MGRRMAVALVGLALGRAALADPTSLTVEALGGAQSILLGQEGAANAVLSREGASIVGGTVLLHLGGWGIGLGMDKTLGQSVAQPWSVFVNGGPVVALLSSLRLELLAEIGRRGFESFWDFSLDDSAASYHTYLGVRPGLSVRLVPLPLRLGVSGMVRWSLRNGDLGSPDIGIAARVGFEIGGW